ncbi:MAG: type III-B CRISPR module RAMP protein Cmr4 [Myxococcales bacterium]|nr:type III-B CRISPR module RAMP protein Cmr4 [Myxococcales bacterium]
MSTQILFIHALSPLHAGTGLSEGAIELAIARDRATGFPCLPGSSLKGALRDRSLPNQAMTRALFGPDPTHASEHAGGLLFGDANLLLLPMRSLAGTFAWTTSPFLISRLRRDCAETGLPPPPQPTVSKQNECLVAKDTLLGVRLAQDAQGERVVGEDLDFVPHRGGADELARWLAPYLFPGDAFWQKGLRQRLCVVHDDVMGFLAQHATQVVARVVLSDDSKTVQNLWHEESLPTESVLCALVSAAPTASSGMEAAPMMEALAHLVAQPIQLGGKATVGRGRCRLVLSSQRSEAQEAHEPAAPRATSAPPPSGGAGGRSGPPHGPGRPGGQGGPKGGGGRR